MSFTGRLWPQDKDSLMDCQEAQEEPEGRPGPPGLPAGLLKAFAPNARTLRGVEGGNGQSPHPCPLRPMSLWGPFFLEY